MIETTVDFQDGKQVDRCVLNCADITVSASGFDVLCHGALVFKDGQVQFQGETNFNTCYGRCLLPDGESMQVLFKQDGRFTFAHSVQGGYGNMTKIKILLAAVLPLTIAAVVLGTQSAQASTPECTNGTFSGYCGTQADHGSPVLVIDSARMSYANNNPVIGWSDSTSDPATDWFQLPYRGDPSLGVMFFFAPTGVVVGMCMSDPGDGRVRLRDCNGSNWQRWIPTQVGNTQYHTLTNRATHRILQAGRMGAQLVTVPRPATITGTQQWTFSH